MSVHTILSFTVIAESDDAAKRAASEQANLLLNAPVNIPGLGTSFLGWFEAEEPSVDDVIDLGPMLAFTYAGKRRLVKPIAVKRGKNFYNGTYNILLVAEEDGQVKSFNVAEIVPDPS
jgi:hypothetical protein